MRMALPFPSCAVFLCVPSDKQPLQRPYILSHNISDALLSDGTVSRRYCMSALSLIVTPCIEHKAHCRPRWFRCAPRRAVRSAGRLSPSYRKTRRLKMRLYMRACYSSSIVGCNFKRHNHFRKIVDLIMVRRHICSTDIFDNIQNPIVQIDIMLFVFVWTSLTCNC